MQDLRSTTAAKGRTSSHARSASQSGASNHLTQRVGERRPGRKPRGPRLTVEQRREADARMQKRLNLMKIMQVVRGTLASGWFEMTLDEFLNTPVEDYGDRIEICYEDGSIFRVMGFDGETVNLRKVASGGAS